MRRGVVIAMLMASAATLTPAHAWAQERRGNDSAFADLRRDGNGVGALRSTIAIGFSGTAESALRAIAGFAKLNLTFDPRLAGMGTTLTIAPHERPASVALLEVARAGKFRVLVSKNEQIVVVAQAAPAPDTHPRSAASAADAVTLPIVTTRAPRIERQDFESRATLGGVSVTNRQLNIAPQFIEPDVLRSVQLFPGVAARTDYAAGFNVRGGEADQNLILLDGYPIYNPFHLGGLFSTFIDQTVGRVELRTGGMPAQFGGRLSGVLDVRSAEETRGAMHGSAEVSLVSSSASVGQSFADGEGSWMLAARRTYADAFINLIESDVVPYHFQDVQAHVTRSFTGGMRLAVTAYDGLDITDPKNPVDPDVSWGNGVVGATLSKRFDVRPTMFGRVLGDSVTIEQRVSLSRFGMHIDDQNGFTHAANTVLDRRFGGAITVHGKRLTQTLGYELAGQRLAFDAASVESNPNLIPLDSVRQRARSTSVYADELWKPAAAWLIDAGLRYDGIEHQSRNGVSPRVAIKYFLNRDVAITAAAGSYRQWIHSLGREEEPIQPLQFWVASDSSAPVSRARDAILGLERWMTPSRLLHVEAFYKRYDDLLVPNPLSDSRVHGDEFNVVGGTSYGVDVLLRQLDSGPFSGWLSYSYALSSRVTASGQHYSPTQDRRHNLNLVGSWHAGAYAIGARLNAASGYPFTPQLGSYVRNRYDPVTRRWVPDDSSPSVQAIAGPLNSDRLPWYERLDVSVTRSTRLFGAPFEPYLSIVNVFNAHNPAAYLYDFYGQPSRGSFPNLPFVPTLGFTLAY